jgi:hypothetical protein
VVAGGQGILLKLQLVSKKNQVGLPPDSYRRLTQGARRKTKLAREGINYRSIRQAAERLWETLGDRGILIRPARCP